MVLDQFELKIKSGGLDFVRRKIRGQKRKSGIPIEEWNGEGIGETVYVNFLK